MFINGTLFGALGVSLFASFGFCAAPRGGDADVAVVFAPWVSSAAAIERATAAGGTLVRLGRYPFVVILHPGRDWSTGPAPRLGAWFVASAAVGGCRPAGGLRS